MTVPILVSESVTEVISPTDWCAIDTFPLTGSGKIYKFALRAGYLEGEYSELKKLTGFSE